jgi:alkanesulfonate monooxygenase SsuD/methylene tetrahydromethanopterin reductase-like flavin-dependent oxidoreductase (luciferase family)
MPSMPAFGLNRFNYTSPPAFAADARPAEALGWDCAFIPSSPLRRQDPYVHLAFAAVQTERIGLGPLIETPIMRHPAVIASSIATVESLAPGRTLLGYGVGDTAVRLMGKRPATIAELEAATILTRQLLAGEEVEVKAARPAKLQHALPVPVWIAAGGPRTLRMAGRVADGVFIRVGKHAANLRTAFEAVRAGALEAGRDPGSVKMAVILHTIPSADTASRRTASRLYRTFCQRGHAPVQGRDGSRLDLAPVAWRPGCRAAPGLFLRRFLPFSHRTHGPWQRKVVT